MWTQGNKALGSMPPPSPSTPPTPPPPYDFERRYTTSHMFLAILFVINFCCLAVILMRRVRRGGLGHSTPPPPRLSRSGSDPTDPPRSPRGWLVTDTVDPVLVSAARAQQAEAPPLVRRSSSSEERLDHLTQIVATLPRIDALMVAEVVSECSICLVNFSDTPDLVAVQLPCDPQHIFHAECLETWIRQPRAASARGECPLCKSALLRDDEEIGLAAWDSVAQAEELERQQESHPSVAESEIRLDGENERG